MKKIMLFAVACIALVACNKNIENEQPEKQFKPGETITLSARVSNDATKVTSDDIDADTVSFKWQKGDKVLLFLANDALTVVTESQVFTIIDETISADGKSADFTGKALSSMESYYALYCGTNAEVSKVTEGNNGGNLILDNFDNNLNLYALGFSNKDGFALDYFIPTIHLKLTGDVTIGKVEYGYEKGNPPSFSAKTTINCNDGVVLTSTPQDFLIPYFSAQSSGFDLKFYDMSGDLIMTKHTDSKSLYDMMEGFGLVSFPELEVKSSLPEGALSGVFSVSATKKVYFSKGNLWTNTTANPKTWSFEANQYDIQSSLNTSHVSLFFWTNRGDYGSVSNYLSYSTSPTSNTVDWGVQYCSANSLTAGTWCTLTIDEWNYLLNSRTNAANKIGYATVAGVKGIIILPDSFTDPKKNGGSGPFVPQPVNENSRDWTNNVYTEGDNWNAMEAAGALFLPAAGERLDSNFYEVGDKGRYWSSTSYDSSSAWHLFFSSQYVSHDNYQGYYYGYPVRLVTAAQ